MKIAGVIVNYRTPELALEAARALAEQLTAHPGSTIYLVENDSGDGSEETIRQGLSDAGWAASVRLVPSGRNGGFGFGNNVGIRLGLAEPEPPDAFYFLNPDARPDPGAVDAIVAFLEAEAEAHIVGTGVHGGDGVARQVAFRFPSFPSEVDGGMRLGLVSRALSRWKMPLPIPEEAAPCDWVTGSSMVIRREVFERVGLFDEGFFLYYEEIDLCHRAKDAGLGVYHLPGATVVHEQGAATGIHDKSRRVPGYWFESRWRYFRKHHGIPYALSASAGWAASRVVGRGIGQLRGRVPKDPPKLVGDFLTHTGRAAWRSIRGGDDAGDQPA